MTTAPVSGTFRLAPEVAELVDGAFDKRLPFLIAHVDPDEVPHMTLRGSTHVHSSSALALWARHRDGGFVQSIAKHDQVTLLYRDMETRTTLFFYGTATTVADDETAVAVYLSSPEPERNADSDQLGCAVIIELHRIEGRLAGEPYEAVSG